MSSVTLNFFPTLVHYLKDANSIFLTASFTFRAVIELEPFDATVCLLIFFKSTRGLLLTCIHCLFPLDVLQTISKMRLDSVILHVAHKFS
jgi:hypothetical protein